MGIPAKLTQNAAPGKSRVILLGPRAQGVILPLLIADPAAFVFRSKVADGGRYHPQSVRNAVLRVCRKLEIDPWHPHQLRHSAATRFRREAGMEVASTALGHASLDMTQHYAEKNLDAARAVFRRIG